MDEDTREKITADLAAVLFSATRYKEGSTPYLLHMNWAGAIQELTGLLASEELRTRITNDAFSRVAEARPLLAYFPSPLDDD